jgi:hypothetical protein
VELLLLPLLLLLLLHLLPHALVVGSIKPCHLLSFRLLTLLVVKRCLLVGHEAGAITEVLLKHREAGMAIGHGVCSGGRAGKIVVGVMRAGRRQWRAGAAGRGRAARRARGETRGSERREGGSLIRVKRHGHGTAITCSVTMFHNTLSIVNLLVSVGICLCCFDNATFLLRCLTHILPYKLRMLAATLVFTINTPADIIGVHNISIQCNIISQGVTCPTRTCWAPGTLFRPISR